MRYLPIFLLLSLAIPGSPGASAQDKTLCALQHKVCITEAGFPACVQKIDIVKYYEFNEKGEDELAEQIIADEDKCIILLGNENAFMQDQSSGFVKFALRGKNKTYWAKQEALFTRSP